MVFDIEMIKKVYASFGAKVLAARKAVKRPLTLTEKILYTHLWQGDASISYEKGKSYIGEKREIAGRADEPGNTDF